MRTRPGSRRLVIVAAVASLTLAACSSATSADPPSTSAGESQATAESAAPAPTMDPVNPDAEVSGPITIGYQDIGSSKVMAEVYAKALEEAGFDVQLTVPGQQADFVPAMKAGVVDLLPAYSGVFANYLYKSLNNDADPPVWKDELDAASAVNEMGADLGIEMLKPSTVNEGAVFAVSKDFSEANGITTLSQMAEWSKNYPMRLGGESTCETRPYCKPNLEKTYGMQVKDFVALSADGAIVKQALIDGGVDLGWLSGSDPMADSPDLVALEEDKPLIIYRNLAPLLRRDIATPEVVAALDAVTEKVTNEDLDALVTAVAVDDEPIGRVAGEYISAQGLGEGLYTGPTKVVGVSVPGEEVQPPATEAPEGGPLRIAYAPVVDVEIAARVYAAALAKAGIKVALGDPMDPADLVTGLSSGDVQFAPVRLNAAANILNTNANGNLATPIEGRDVDKMVQDASDLAGPLGIELLEPSAANVSNAWIVTKNFIANTGIDTLSELARVSQNRPIYLGGPEPCPERVWCEPFLRNEYRVKVAQFVPLDWGGGLTRGAVDSGAVDVGWLSGNDGGIEQFGFSTLKDDLGRESVNPITPALNAQSITPEITKVLNRVSAALTTEDLRHMNHQIEFERQEISDVVAKFIKDKDLG